MFVKERFTLNEKIVKNIKEQGKDFKFPFGLFGEAVFYRTYSRKIYQRNGIILSPDEEILDNDQYYGMEDWADVVLRCVNGTFSIRKDWYLKNHIHWNEEFWQDYAINFSQYLFDMKWMPAGRGLWIMGTHFIYSRGGMAANNCFAKETRFLTDKGFVKFEDVIGQTVNVLTKDGSFHPATVRSFGKQHLRTVVFKPNILGKTKVNIRISCTSDHEWVLSSGKLTKYLSPGDIVKSSPTLILKENIEKTQDYIDGFTHGFIFGDGTKQTYTKSLYKLRLCGKKNKYSELIDQSSYYERTNFIGEDQLLYFRTDVSLKCVPEEYTTFEYKFGFVNGWLAADAYENDRGVYHLDTISEEGVNWLYSYNKILGYFLRGHSITDKDTNFGKRTLPLNRFYIERDNLDIDFKVLKIEFNQREEEVYCVIEPKTNTFTLEGGILTRNCAFVNLGKNFAEDLRWAMDALMCGCGVGFRPVRDDSLRLYMPTDQYDFVVEDTRESWANSVKALVMSYLKPRQKKPKFQYHKIRKRGLPIKGFGGIDRKSVV